MFSARQLDSGGIKKIRLSSWWNAFHTFPARGYCGVCENMLLGWDFMCRVIGWRCVLEIHRCVARTEAGSGCGRSRKKSRWSNRRKQSQNGRRPVGGQPAAYVGLDTFSVPIRERRQTLGRPLVPTTPRRRVKNDQVKDAHPKYEVRRKTKKLMMPLVFFRTSYFVFCTSAYGNIAIRAKIVATSAVAPVALSSGG